MSPAVLTLLILAVSIVLFVFEVFPMGVTALLTAVVLFLFGIIDATALFAQLVNSNTLLVAAMCVMGEAIFATGMAQKAGNLITRFAKTERALMVGTMTIAGIMSAFLTNFGTIACLMPIVCGIAAAKNIRPIKLLLPLCAGATVGGTITLAGSPGNLTAKTVIEEMSNGELTVTFWEYGRVALPMLIGIIVVMALFGSKLIPDREPGEYVAKQIDYSKIPAWKGWFSLGVFAVAVILMSARSYIKSLPGMHVIATIACLVLVLAGILTQKEAFESIDMQVIFLISFVTPLSNALRDTGAGEMIANFVSNTFSNASPYVLTAVIWLVTWALTQVMSNTAASALFCPIAWEIGVAIGADPRATVIAALFGSSVAMCTPLAMPGDAMVMGPAGAKFQDFFKSGIAMSAACFVISMILLPIFYPFY